MSYAMSAALQEAVFQRLSSDMELVALVGGVFDAPPPGPLPDTYVLLGEETVKDRSTSDGVGADHEITISILSENAGFLTAKQAAVHVNDALLGADLPLSRGVLVGLWFHRAVARQGTADARRRIDIRFRARVEDTSVN